MQKIKLLSIYVISLSLVGVPTIQASASVGSPKPLVPNTTKCRLVVDDAHISTSDKEKTGLDYVKVKAWSECYLTQSSVMIHLTIYRVDPKGGDKEVRSFDNYKGIKSGKLVEITDAKVLCVNKKPTKYYGVAKAHVVIPGMGVFDKGAFSAIKNTLNCGT